MAGGWWGTTAPPLEKKVLVRTRLEAVVDGHRLLDLLTSGADVEQVEVATLQLVVARLATFPELVGDQSLQQVGLGGEQV